MSDDRKQYFKDYYRAHRTERLEYSREYYKKNKYKINTSKNKQYAEDEQVKKSKQNTYDEYYKKHKYLSVIL